MKYETKSAQYYNYFEDAKLIEIDDDNKKLAIVLNGKEEVIDIFDAGPYVDYNPFENYINEIKLQKEKESNDKIYGVLYIQEETNYLDVNEIFQEIKNYKKDINKKKNRINNLDSQINLNSNNKSNLNNNKKGLVEGKNLFIHNSNQNQNNISNLPRIFSKFEEKSEEQNNAINGLKEIKKYTILSKTKFQIYYLSQYKNYKNIKINVKKPKIKHKLLSVINLNNDSVLGIKWFCFNRIDKNDDFKNLSEIEKYIKKSKLLLVVGQEGLISVYQLIGYQPFNHIRVNLTLNGLQTQPFTNYKERYNLATSLKLFNPIIDFNLLDKPYNNCDLTEIRLITLHINNTFTFWKIIYENEQIKLTIHYNFQLSNFICENFLMDSNEEYLVCFNKKGIMILLTRLQSFPFPIIYRYTYNENVPSLKELKELIYSNEVISEDDDKINDNIKEIKNNKKKKEKNGKSKINQISYKEKNQTKKKDKKKNKIDDDDLFIIKEDKDNEEDENEEEDNENDDEEEEEDNEKDEFINEDNPNFINNDEDLFLEDDKFLKFLQKPSFLGFETKLLFVNYEIKSNEYSLYCFDFSQLYKVEEDQNFLSLCLNEYDDILITKIYSSKEKIYFSESPFAYFHPIKDESIDNNLLSSNSNRKILKEMKFEINKIVNNLYEGLFIREGDNIIIIKLPVKNKPDLDLINDDIKLSKYIFYEQPTSENLKSNCLAKWTINNTLIIHSVNSLFNIIKFRKEAAVLGIPISKKKVIEILINFK